MDAKDKLVTLEDLKISRDDIVIKIDELETSRDSISPAYINIACQSIIGSSGNDGTTLFIIVNTPFNATVESVTLSQSFVIRYEGKSVSVEKSQSQETTFSQIGNGLYRVRIPISPAVDPNRTLYLIEGSISLRLSYK